MRRSRITITVDKYLLNEIDGLVDLKKIRNRSHAIEYIVSNYFKQSAIKTAVILAGGEGTEFRPFTYEIPKSLLPVKGKPILEHMINHLKKSGITEIILCVDYLADKIIKYFGNGDRLGINIIYSQEKDSLQTGGAILKAKKNLANKNFLVIHGDILTKMPIKDLIDFHRNQKTLATVALTTVDQPADFGQLQLHGTKLVQFFQKKTEIRSHLINCGIYIFEPDIFNYFPKNKKSFMLEDVIEGLINDKKVSGFVFESQWFDVGTPRNYEKAIKDFKI